MQLLLCAATENEIDPALSHLIIKPRQDVDILITGVGMMAAAVRLTEKITRKPYRFVLQAGVCGSLDKGLPLTETVVVKHESIGDLGVEENGLFTSVFDLKLTGPNESPWQEKRLTNVHDSLSSSQLPVVNGVTVNEISTNMNRISYYREILGADVETMEGAALHYVCLLENVPFLQLRSVSNYIGERDKSNWDMNGAIEKLNQHVLRLLEMF